MELKYLSKKENLKDIFDIIQKKYLQLYSKKSVMHTLII